MAPETGPFERQDYPATGPAGHWSGSKLWRIRQLSPF